MYSVYKQLKLGRQWRLPKPDKGTNRQGGLLAESGIFSFFFFLDILIIFPESDF